MDIERIRDTISDFTYYIENFTIESKERDTALVKLKEAVFWLTYLIDDNEEV